MQAPTRKAPPVRTLVLNAGYEPLAIVSFRRALMLVMSQKATVLKADADHPIEAITAKFDRPSVIVLSRYVRVPYARRVPLTRRGVLRRDGHHCAYCGKNANTIDHVIPKSRGGSESWENLVACCFKCNNIKSDRTPQEMGWRLRITPRMPAGPSWFAMGLDHRDTAWDDYLEPAA